MAQRDDDRRKGSGPPPDSQAQGFDRPEYREERDNHPYGGKAAEHDRTHGHERPRREDSDVGFGGETYHAPKPGGGGFPDDPHTEDAPTTRYDVPKTDKPHR